jgi:hypothetical protein
VAALRALLAGVALVATAWGVAAAAAIAVPDVVSITIDSAWGGLGRHQSYHGRIERGPNGFVRDDGARVDAAAIAALLQSLEPPHPARLLPADAGFTTEILRADLVQSESCLGKSARFAPVRDAFEREYLSLPAIGRWLDAGFAVRHTDDYPSVRVRIETKRGGVGLVSFSQHLFMLPFAVERDGAEQSLFDARIPHAIAALMPDGAVNEKRLASRSLVAAWAAAVCRGDAVRAAAG